MKKELLLERATDSAKKILTSLFDSTEEKNQKALQKISEVLKKTDEEIHKILQGDDYISTHIPVLQGGYYSVLRITRTPAGYRLSTRPVLLHKKNPGRKQAWREKAMA